MSALRRRSPLRLSIAGLLVVEMLSSCASTEGWTKGDWELARLGISPEQHKLDNKASQVWKMHIRDAVYVGMPEEGFVERFTKTAAWTDPERPYIIHQSDHRYVILQAPAYGKNKGRFTFRDGILVKYEQFGLGENPFGYSDCTFLLLRR